MKGTDSGLYPVTGFGVYISIRNCVVAFQLMIVINDHTRLITRPG